MLKLNAALVAFCAIPALAAPAAPKAAGALSPAEVLRLQAIAKRVTILRDKWGIPHIYGKSDADAVFGMLYAQSEDDFKRIELNFINAMGRLAEVEGEKALYQDLRMKLFITPEQLKAQYKASPDWLKKLMVAWADGLNFYLHTHPQVQPRLLTRFEPWMALSFSEGSIGGDIETVNIEQLKAFYSKRPAPTLAAGGSDLDNEPRGSNGFAIAPALSKSGHALLMINPHTSFYFRPEIHVISQEGLNAYGAVTWGQFFVYQGFNDRIGWMHTSGGGDVIDEYLETVVEKDGKFFYQYGKELRPFRTEQVRLPYKAADPAAIWAIFICSIWPMIVNTAVGVQRVPQDYLNVARVLNLSEWKVATKILLPSVLPYMLTGVRLAIGTAWLVIVAAEMLTGGVGIGFWVWDEWNNLNVPHILIAIGVIGVVGLLLELALVALAKAFSYEEK